MKYWASDIAVIPIEGSPGLAETGIAPENEWIYPGIASWMLCGEHHRRLFLQLLFGSLCLIIGHQTAQATPIHPAPSPKFTLLHHPNRGEAVHFYPQLRALLNLYGNYSAGWVEAATGSESPNETRTGAGSQASGPGQSKIEHQKSDIKNAPKWEVRSRKCEVKTGQQQPSSSYLVNFRLPIPTSIVSAGLPSIASAPDFLFRFPLPTFHFPLPTSNGALLAHQTTSIANPSPTARNGVAARTPLPEAGERGYKMNHHFQICTRGYLAWPGIPVPASGLFIGHVGGNHRVNVERWKGVKDGQPPPFTHSHLYTFTHSSLNPEEP